MIISFCQKIVRLPLVLLTGITLILFFSMVLLLGGYGELSAHSNEINTSYHSMKNFNISEQRDLSSIQNNEISSTTTSFDIENQNYPLDLAILENKEDEEMTSSKRHMSTFTFFTQTLESFFNHSKIILSFNKFFSKTSSSRYLIFQVFRI